MCKCYLWLSPAEHQDPWPLVVLFYQRLLPAIPVPGIRASCAMSNPDIGFILLQSGDIESNPGPNGKKTICYGMLDIGDHILDNVLLF